MHLLQLLRDRRGAAVIEMAIALPVLVFIIYGIFETALLLRANAGMQHGLGEGARYATIYPTPSDTAINAKVTNALFGMEDAKPGFPTVAVVPDAASKTKTITVTYKKDVDFLFLATRTITITHSKKAYVAQ